MQGYDLEDKPGTREDRDGEKERVWEIHAVGATMLQ